MASVSAEETKAMGNSTIDVVEGEGGGRERGRGPFCASSRIATL
jgi:hypothetical protein